MTRHAKVHELHQTSDAVLAAIKKGVKLKPGRKKKPKKKPALNRLFAPLMNRQGKGHAKLQELKR